ncbi:MAG: hypothetical protein KDD60_02235 [Bdellovibrionales bacterium]|nr:hypothetical protein [Bdellovibrionales bacterium]
MSTVEGNTSTAALRAELRRCEDLLNRLKTEYEQHFMGILRFPPDDLHRQMRMALRELRRSPFRNSQINYQLRAIEQRYQTYNTYWMRVQRQREEGTYFRDVFKAELREKIAHEEAEKATDKGKVKSNVKALFDTYQTALERQSGKKLNLDYEKFQKKLVQQAKLFRKQNGDAKLSFKVVMKDGKVTVQAKAKGNKGGE